MCKVLVSLAILSLGVAAPLFDEDAQAKILSYKNDNDGFGNYEFSFETSNGISRHESGRIVSIGQPDEHLEVQGTYSFTDAEGKLVIVNYTADENGYQVSEGEPISLPPITVVAAPLPPAAVASLLG